MKCNLYLMEKLLVCDDKYLNSKDFINICSENEYEMCISRAYKNDVYYTTFSCFNNYKAAMNNFKLIVDYDNEINDSFEISKVFNKIELKISYDKFSYNQIHLDIITGEMLLMMLKYYGLTYTVEKNTVIIPIPFHSITNNSVLLKGEMENCDIKIYVQLISKSRNGTIVDVKMRSTSITYDNVQLIDNCFEFLCKRNFIENYYCSTNYFDLPSSLPTKDLFFVFLDDNKLPIREKQFDSVHLVLDLNRTIFKQEQLRLLTDTKYGDVDNVYNISVENIGTFCDKFLLYNYDFATLHFENINPKCMSIVIWTVGYNFVRYMNGLVGVAFAS